MADLKVLKEFWLPGYLFWLWLTRSCPLCHAPIEKVGDPVLHLASEHLDDIKRALEELRGCGGPKEGSRKRSSFPERV